MARACGAHRILLFAHARLQDSGAKGCGPWWAGRAGLASALHVALTRRVSGSTKSFAKPVVAPQWQLLAQVVPDHQTARPELPWERRSQLRSHCRLPGSGRPLVVVRASCLWLFVT